MINIENYEIQWLQGGCSFYHANNVLTFPIIFSRTGFQGICVMTSVPGSGTGTLSFVSMTTSKCTIYGDYTHDSANTTGRVIVIGV